MQTETCKANGSPAESLHVLFTCHRFWPNVGGTEFHVEGLAKALIARGHQVTVATSAEPGAPAEETHHGIQVRRFPLRRLGPFRVPPKAYARFVTKGPWDLVHVHGQRVWNSEYLFRHLPRLRCPAVFTPHGFYQYHMKPRSLVERWYYHRRFPRVTNSFAQLVAITHAERDEMMRFGIPAHKIFILPAILEGSEFERRPPPEFRAKFGLSRRFLLLYVGGYFDNKRVPFLVEAVAQMRSPVELVVLGSDPTGGRAPREIETLAQRLGAPVRLLGVLDRRDVVHAFWESDLFLLASRFEGYGLALLEAMAAGVPFVATPSGAVPELAAQGAGQIVDTPALMAQAAEALLIDGTRRAQMGRTARRVAMRQTFSWAAEQLEGVYERLLKAPGRSS